MLKSLLLIKRGPTFPSSFPVTVCTTTVPFFIRNDSAYDRVPFHSGRHSVFLWPVPVTSVSGCWGFTGKSPLLMELSQNSLAGVQGLLKLA